MVHAPIDARAGAGTEAGYSLIEVIVVLMIFSLLAGIVEINLRKPLQSTKYKAVHSDIIEVVQLTRAEAANRGKLVHFNEILTAQRKAPDAVLIDFPGNAGAEAYGACRETLGSYDLDGARYSFRVEPVTCRVTFNV